MFTAPKGSRFIFLLTCSNTCRQVGPGFISESVKSDVKLVSCHATVLCWCFTLLKKVATTEIHGVNRYSNGSKTGFNEGKILKAPVHLGGIPVKARFLSNITVSSHLPTVYF